MRDPAAISAIPHYKEDYLLGEDPYESQFSRVLERNKLLALSMLLSTVTDRPIYHDPFVCEKRLIDLQVTSFFAVCSIEIDISFIFMLLCIWLYSF